MTHREKELRDVLYVALAMLEVEARDHREKRSYTDKQRDSISANYYSFCYKIRTMLQHDRQEAA